MKKNTDGRIEIAFGDLDKPYEMCGHQRDGRFVANLQINQKSYFFKANSKNSFDEVEIINYVLKSKLGLPTVKMFPCTFMDEMKEVRQGVLMEDYINDRANTIVLNGAALLEQNDMFLGNSVRNHVRELEEYRLNLWSSKGVIIDIENDLEEKLLLEFAFAMLTINEDLFEHNISYSLLDEQLTLNPVTDHSVSFLINSFYGSAPNLASSIGLPDQMKVIKDFAKNIKYPFMIQINPQQKDDYHSAWHEFEREFFENYSFRAFVKQIEQIDLKEEMNAYLLRSGFKIDNQVLNLANAVFEHGKEKVHTINQNYHSSLQKKSNSAKKINFQSEFGI